MICNWKKLFVFAELLAFTFLLAPWGMTVAHDFELDIVSGVDSNPNKLSDTLDLDNGAFSEGRFEFSHIPAYSGYYYELEASRTDYKTGESITDEVNTDELYGDAVLGYKWRPILKYGRARFKWEVNYNLKDSVYVDRATGDVKYYHGEEIGNRFDATWLGVDTTGKVPLSEDAFFVFEVKLKDKDYEDYSYIPDPPSNLDYQQGEMVVGFEKEIWPKTVFENSIGYAVREYDDRIAKEANGDEIEGTNLEYKFIEAKNAIEYNFSKRWKWQWGLDIYQRTDNEGGYYDSTAGKLYTRLRYRNGDYVKFKFNVSYYQRKYDQLIDDDADVEDDLKTREGVRMELEYIHRILRKKYVNLDLIMGLNFDDFDNTNVKFQYERFQTYAGIRWQPY